MPSYWLPIAAHHCPLLPTASPVPPCLQLRRESANLAAREAVAAARRQLLGDNVSASAVKAARAAAREAAAAAADACGTCSGLQGDNEELDSLWICCDTCMK